MQKINPWKKISSKIVYKNDWFFVREDEVEKPNNRQGIYGVLVTPPSVFIIPLTEKNEVYLVGFYRYPTQKYGLEIPAGSSDNQELLVAAKRELLEETGLKAESWEKIGEFTPLNGIASETSHIFIARNLENTGSVPDENEGIMEVKKISLDEISNLIKSGEINDGQTIAALAMAMMHLKKL